MTQTTSSTQATTPVATLELPAGLTPEMYEALQIVPRGTWAPEDSAESDPFGPLYRGENGRVCQKVKKGTMDEVCAWGTPSNLARLAGMDDAKLARALAWAAARRPVANVQAVMPARADKQVGAFAVYTKALRALETAVRAEQSKRLAASVEF